MKLNKDLNMAVLKAINEGIEKSLLLFDDDDISFNKTSTKLDKKSITNQIEYLKFILDDFVDLGLPSGTLWMKYNLGATCGETPESWYGDYYAWGELETKEEYTKDTYTYNVNPTTLPVYHDIVYQTYIKIFPYQKMPVIPTSEQIEELVENTICEWVENYNGIKGLNGGIFTSKVNDTVLFIPAAGYRYGSDLYYVDYNCRLWSSSLNPSDPCSAWRLSFNSDVYSDNASNRCDGLSVRGVL